MFPYNHDLKVSEATYSDAAYEGIQRMQDLRMDGSPAMRDYLNSAAVYAFGTEFSKNFPILTELQGGGKKRPVKSIDNTVYMYLFGKPKKTSVVAKCVYNPNDKIGKDKNTVFIYFKDRWFMKNQKIIAGGFDMVQLHLMDNGVREGSFYKYEAKTIGNNSYTIPYKYMKPGAIWGGGAVVVSNEHSRGTEHRSYSGYRIQNQIAKVRQSFKVAGNASNKVMNIAVNIGGKSFTTYVDFDRYITELAFNEAKELDLIISKWNKDDQGMIQNYDSNSGKPAPMFMGIWEQIPSFNTLEYTRLSENKLRRWLTDILSISSNLDMIGKSGSYIVDIVGGYGLLEEFDAAMKRQSSLLTPMLDSNLFIGKSDGKRDGLQYGAYFTSYKHISGVIFRFTHHPFFDANSPLADTSPVHPLNPSLRLSSYFGMVMNFGQVVVSKDSAKDGVASNIEYLYEDGLEYDEWVVEGGAQLPGHKKSYSRSTDIDASSWEMLCTQGVHCHYPMSMGKIICTI